MVVAMWSNAPCDYCETESEEQIVEELPWPGPDGMVLFHHVKAKVCRRCGEIWVDAHTARRLDETLAAHPKPVSTVMKEVPVYACP